MRRSNWPPNCIVPLQIAQVQVSTELLEVSGMDSKDSSPKTVLPLVSVPKELACRRPPSGFLVPYDIVCRHAAISYVDIRCPMRFVSHFKSSFGNVKAFNLKNLKLSLSPSPQWPEAALRQSLGRRRIPSAELRQDRIWKGILRIHSRNL